ncbi:MAG: hypothetical protein CMJ83_20315 [Planctomycetes bacterium]|nr:hypothetical protein [Planctomycetota bacterium]
MSEYKPHPAPVACRNSADLQDVRGPALPSTLLGHESAALPQIFLLSCLAGWLNREQQKVLDYLREDNRVLREQSVPAGSGSTMISAPGLRRRARRSAVSQVRW